MCSSYHDVYKMHNLVSLIKEAKCSEVMSLLIYEKQKDKNRVFFPFPSPPLEEELFGLCFSFKSIILCSQDKAFPAPHRDHPESPIFLRVTSF